MFWGFFGLVYLEDAGSYSWQPLSYSWNLELMTYAQYIRRGLFVWAWAALGVAQLYLPKRVRKYVIAAHCSLTGIMMVGGLIREIFVA